MGDVKDLKETNPDFALVLEADDDRADFSSLSHKKVPVHDLLPGYYILVKAGEVCACELRFS